MRYRSKKRAKRDAEVRQFRQDLVVEVGRCEVCGNRRRKLDCHEIANGPLREKCLDKRYGLLVTCWPCNSDQLTDKAKYPEAWQLAILKRSRPKDYSLADYNALKGYGKHRISEEDVEQWETSSPAGGNLTK